MLINTLYIHIDDTPIPNEVKQCCFSLDCREINNFCSFMGDVLLGDMKDSDGTPFYRIVSPAGKLISDFEQVDEKAFCCIIKEWYKLLMYILQDVSHTSVLNFTFPEIFSNRLLSSTNEYINRIGENLLNHNNVVEFSKKDILEDVIFDKISKSISEELTKKHYEFIAFSSSDINSGSIVEEVLSIEYGQTHFITFGQLKNWGRLLDERNLELRNILTYDNFHLRYESFIKIQIEYAFGKIMKDLVCIQDCAFFANFSLWKREKVESIIEDEVFCKAFFESEKQLASSISIKVQEFREENEFKIYNDYEDRICKTLGIAFYPRTQDFFIPYHYPPMNINTVIANFAQIITDFNEENAETDLGIGFIIGRIDSLKKNKPNHYIDYLKRSLLCYYNYYCLGILKDSLNFIWDIYEPKIVKNNAILKNGCYITTAMCNYLGKPDDCYELTILRGFRDNWLCHQINGAHLIQVYYKYAPTIVDKLKLSSDKEIIYNQIKDCIYKCLLYIREQQFEMAKNAYISMIKTLLNKYI